MAKFVVNLAVNARISPEMKGDINKIGVLQEGWELEGEPIGGDWVKLTMYARKGNWLKEIGQAPISVRKPPMLGVHVRFHTHNADWSLANGCKFVVCMDDKLGAVQLARKYPDAKVCYRRFIGQSRPSPDEMVQLLGVAPQDPPMLFVGYNESDSIGTSAKEIEERAFFDVEVARRIKAISPSSLYLAGTFAHGNPDITNPEICNAMKKFYAPHYNSGLFGFDLHNYSKLELDKNRNQKPAEPDTWFLRRFEWFFTHCGFDPRVQNIWSTETGVEAGHGGFAWTENHGWGDTQFRDWCALHQRECGRDMIINGTVYPSPYKGGAIFQMGVSGESGNGSWSGYNIFGRKEILKEFWK